MHAANSVDPDQMTGLYINVDWSGYSLFCKYQKIGSSITVIMNMGVNAPD